MDNGRIATSDDSKVAVSGESSDIAGITPDVQTADRFQSDVPRLRLLTRPAQTAPVTLPFSTPTQGAMSLLTPIPPHNEERVVQEEPCEGLQEGLYDLADPSVNLHEFIVSCLATPKDRLFMLHVEKELVQFIEDSSRDVMEFPSMTSYHRMLLHRVAAYFGLEHNVGPSGQAIFVSKAIFTRLPKMRFLDLLPAGVSREETASPKLILKRSLATETPERMESPAVKITAAPETVKKSKTMAEREAEYEKARARIFSQPALLREQAHQFLDSGRTQQPFPVSNVAVPEEVPPCSQATAEDFGHDASRRDFDSCHLSNVSKETQYYQREVHDIVQPTRKHMSMPQSTADGMAVTRPSTIDFSTPSAYNPLQQHSTVGLHYPQHMVPLAAESVPPNVHPMFVNPAALQHAQMMALLQAQQSVGFPRPGMVSHPFSDITDSEATERETTRLPTAGFQRAMPFGVQFPHHPLSARLGQLPVAMGHTNEMPDHSLQQQQQQQAFLQQQYALEQFRRLQLQQYHHHQQQQQQQQQMQRFQQMQQPVLSYRPTSGGHLPVQPGASRSHSPSPSESNSDNDSRQAPLPYHRSPKSRAEYTTQSRLEFATPSELGRIPSSQRQERRDHPVKAYSAQRPVPLQSIPVAAGQPLTFALEIYEVQGSSQDVKDLVNELGCDGATVCWRNRQSPLSGGLAVFKSHAEMQASLRRVLHQPHSKYKLRVPGQQLLQLFSNLSIT